MEKPTERPRLKAGRPRHPITKDRLIEIAAAIFGEHGFNGASLDRIADAAGIRRASLLHHFASKKVIYDAVLREIAGDLKTFITNAGMGGEDFISALDLLGGRIVTYLGSKPGFARLLVRELVDNGPYFKGGGADTVQQILEVTSAFLKAGMDAGQFKVQDPRQLAFSIIGIHLYYFSAVSSTSRFMGSSAYAPKGVKNRREAVLAHVRTLCLKEKEASCTPPGR